MCTKVQFSYTLAAARRCSYWAARFGRIQIVFETDFALRNRHCITIKISFYYYITVKPVDHVRGHHQKSVHVIPIIGRSVIVIGYPKAKPWNKMTRSYGVRLTTGERQEKTEKRNRKTFVLDSSYWSCRTTRRPWSPDGLEPDERASTVDTIAVFTAFETHTCLVPLYWTVSTVVDYVRYFGSIPVTRRRTTGRQERVSSRGGNKTVVVSWSRSIARRPTRTVRGPNTLATFSCKRR